MRTLLIVVVGVLSALALRWRVPPAHGVLAAWSFSLAWLVVTGWNLRTGLSHGYTLTQEAPIHLVLFGVPVAVMWWATMRSSG